MPFVPDVGIACRGPVRSILLISKVEPCRIRTLAADVSSRTSVMLTRLVLDRVYATRPAIISMRPELESMLEIADAALIIGDPALRLDPDRLPYRVLDLGSEWLNLTGLPMVFALWTGRERFVTEVTRRAFIDSCRYGLDHLDEIVASAPESHGISSALAREYLTRHIVFELNETHHRGLAKFLDWSTALDPAVEHRVKVC
jgi:predicted solute-binding protein